MMYESDHQPRQDLDAEQAVLGAMLTGSALATAAVADMLRPEDFYRDSHAHICRACLAVHGRGEPVDMITVAAELASSDLLEAVGGRDYIDRMVRATPFSTNAPHYARIVADHAARRASINATIRARQILESDPDPASALRRSAEVVQRAVKDHLRTVPARVHQAVPCPAAGDLPHVEPGDKYPLHDIGNGRRFCALYGESFRWCEDWSCWLYWAGSHWVRNADLMARRYAKATAESIWYEASAASSGRDKLVKHWLASCASGKITALLEMAKSDLVISSRELDTDLWALNFTNGTIDLRTGELRPHDPADLITCICSGRYVQDAHLRDDSGSVAWRKFLRDVTNGDCDYALYLQRAFGYGLVGEPREEIVLACYGEARTGKSTLLETVRVHLGDYAEELAFEDLLKKYGSSDLTPGLARLQGKRFVASSESSAGRALNEGLVKTLTGGEAITTAAKYERPVTWVPQLLLVLASNSRPKIPHDDSGMWRRYREIPFIHQMGDPNDPSVPAERRADPGLKSRLRLEAGEAVLAWLVDGCLLWQQEGLGTCSAVERASADCRAEMNPLGGWVAEECRVDPDRTNWFTPTQELYDSYVEWHRHAGERGAAMSLREFGRALKGVVKSDSTQRRVGGRPKMGYTGILLVSNGDPEPEYGQGEMFGDQ